MGLSFNLVSVRPWLVAIEMTSWPDKMTYRVGEKIDTTGAVMRATYSNGNVKNVQWDDAYVNTSAVGQGLMSFSYREGERRMVCVQQANIVPAIPDKAPLDEMSWAQIAEVANAGKAEEYWRVGDTKRIVLRFSNVSVATNVFILGFAHGGEAGTIDFGGFMLDAEDWERCARCREGSFEEGVEEYVFCPECGNDSYYYDEDGEICCGSCGAPGIYVDSVYYRRCMNCGSEETIAAGKKQMIALVLGGVEASMNDSRTNTGGWKDSMMRYNVLGSTHAEGEDADRTATETPVAGSMMSALSEDLREVMLPMVVWTDNVGGGGASASAVSATVDYLPLLAEYEVHGVSQRANPAERAHQVQYAYFAQHGTEGRVAWPSMEWGYHWAFYRSPSAENSEGFCAADSNGGANRHYADMSIGLAPVFRVGKSNS